MSARGEIGPLSAAACIVRIAERQDRAAFIALFTAFAPRVKAFAIRRGAPGPDEITQEVMLAIWRKAASFDPARGAAEAWIFGVARNACIDAMRRARGQPLLELEARDEPEPARGDHQLEAAEDAERVRRAIERLSPEQGEVVRLSFFDDRPHAEIAALLGLPLGTVKSRLRLAMKRLRGLLDDRS